MNEITAYLKKLERDFAVGNATEHSHRPALKSLMELLIPDTVATNEPRQIECGAPDFVVTRERIPLGYIEAKDIGKNLNAISDKEQLKRYRTALGNLLFTDYLTFRLYRNGDLVAETAIADISEEKIKSKRENFDAFSNLIKTFADYDGQTIISANELAKHMAHKARLLAQVIDDAFQQDMGEDDDFSEVKGELATQLRVFEKHLIHDINPKSFADIYAQTVAYGLFTARLHDDTPQTFTRAKAAELIPSSNPFLRKFFQHIAGYDLDDRIRWIVDELADLFRAADVEELMKGYGRATQREDPFIHFYETFLGEYNPKLRKSRGVYYTPEPVVDFIVRAVDEILTNEFKLSDGLAHTGKTTIEVDATAPQKNGKTPKIKKEVHKVQILDPATGTGTFLAAIVKQIYKKFVDKKGVWADYARRDLIPRLNGFEVLMASYAMAHTKLEMVLRDTGYEISKQRLRVYLTNSLEEHHPDTDTLFAQWIATESNEANRIKRNTPVMVVIGNPPYAVGSSNRGAWIGSLLDDYKKNLSERKLNLDDDYIKFIRYGEHLIEKTGEGVLAYISNHSFINGITHRQMRKHLMETFDKIYVLDLHGNSNIKEISPDGSADQNVFDIKAGVSINLFVKTKQKSSKLADVFNFDLYGNRKFKYNFLLENDFYKVRYEKVDAQDPYYFFVPKDFSKQTDYDKGFSMTKLFKLYASGVITRNDDLAVKFSQKEISAVVKNFQNFDTSQLKERYRQKKESANWNFESAKKDLEKNDFVYVNMMYRIFDVRDTVQTKTSSGFISRPAYKTMQHMLSEENTALCTVRQIKGNEYRHSFITNKIFESGLISNKTSEWGYGFPLYLYPDEAQRSLDEEQPRKPNLNESIVKTIAEKLMLRFTPEKETDDKTFAPIDLLDYIYAVLHSPSYRERYIEFLKIDFPRVPYPSDKKLFWKMVKLGGELRLLHLLESDKLNSLTTTYPNSGDHKVIKPEFEITDAKNRIGKVKINNLQHFGGVAESAWTFYIGGYQPAQKWLKDRKGRTLNHDDITHYQKIIVALCETERLMTQIDEVFAPHIS